MNKQIIIGLTSKIAAGKGTIADYLKEKYQANIYGFSTPLRDILNRLYLPLIRENTSGISTLLRSEYGDDLLARIITEDIKKDNNEIIILDGIRRITDIKFAKNLPGFHLVSVLADEKNRYQRLADRTQNVDDATKTFEEFLQDEQRETEVQIPEVMAQAEFEINNNGTMEELYKQVDDLINKLRQ